MQQSNEKHKALITIIGPTASGKTALAVRLAQELEGEIISGDSRQVYKEMDLGTGKDLAEYGNIPYHLIDIRQAGYQYNLREFQEDFHLAFNDISERGKLPILCGGTGLYIQTILAGNINTLVPEDMSWRAAAELLSDKEIEQKLKEWGAPAYFKDWGHRKRMIRALEVKRYFDQHPPAELPAYVRPVAAEKQLLVGIEIDREARRRKISLRLKKRFEEGMLGEVEALLKKVPAEGLIYYGLEYKMITEHLQGKLSYEEMFSSLEAQIHRFAKRQMTFFRRMEKMGHQIYWLKSEAGVDQNIQELLAEWQRS
ncbi:tRNA (adenosine(37)-N6)-dimethylallyltransferase MiaA [Persicobacter sp. CCB-QB2]|uniref:tRNA (adenosine(37)-N6)-dimethylallyltransferase MiaA n=1 Tax=Persicobacter sp. CCB-QB2 TaxID=1561025 RepID=UPI0006A9B384|nr:tRNA (adenosine(37)-N6)-dimethylallyltransferase MiaA [Persicobacter sp. CCB-QB2]